MSALGLLIVGLVIAVGLVGILVPVLPGGLLVFGAIATWAVIERTTAGWVTLGIAAALFVGAEVIKYVWPVRRLRAADVGTPTLALGALCGVVGFFVVPVIGLPIGFVAGVFAAELARRGDVRRAAVATRFAVQGIALSMGVEFAGAALAAMSWLAAVLVG